MNQIRECMPLVMELTVQAPGRPSFVLVLRPMADCYLATDPKDGVAKWHLVGQHYESGSLVSIPLQDVRETRILSLEEVDRYIESVQRAAAERTMSELGIPSATDRPSSPSPDPEPSSPASGTAEAGSAPAP